MKALERWHDIMHSGDPQGMYDLLHEDCIFWSPVVHTPQQGRDISYAYLTSAQQVFSNEFRYVREVVDGANAILEFECMMDGIKINGVDMIRCEGDQIIDFKVMVRPLKAVHKVHEKMQEMLAMMAAKGGR
tara:strand:+ start:1533 stop:1925 length:393 start_codon:yes stop_codon:yes gene_type:complete